MTQNDKYRTLRAKLETFHQWPHTYLFKFIVPSHKLDELKRIFEGHDYRTRDSRKGTYVSLTCERTMPTSQSVIEVYEQVDRIEGAFAL